MQNRCVDCGDGDGKLVQGGSESPGQAELSATKGVVLGGCMEEVCFVITIERETQASGKRNVKLK